MLFRSWNGGFDLLTVLLVEALSYTSVDEMLARARALYEQHREQIEAPVP